MSTAIHHNPLISREIDPLAAALNHKVAHGHDGDSARRVLAAGDGWAVADIVCTCGPADHPYEEQSCETCIGLVLSGTFASRSPHGSALLGAGSLMLVNAREPFECSHPDREGDRCLSFQFAPEFFEQIAHDAGAARSAFAHHHLPPLRALSRATARAARAIGQHGAPFDEIALELAGATIEAAGQMRRTGARIEPAHQSRIARVLRHMSAHTASAHSTTSLARLANLSAYHFLRTFKAVTGVTPHQWLLRARLRDAAERLTASNAPVTEIALDVGFEDLSNFMRSFRAEFGVTPRQYRLAN